jgi:3-oxoacyl-[acyl-carrier protein] reductase
MIREKKKGAIINITSGAAGRVRASAVPYGLSKTALDRLTKGYALELAEYGIRVNAVEPGFASGSASNPLPPEHVRYMGARIPLGRESGPEDTPNAVLYLCSDAASFITGATLAVDGGNSAGVRAVFQERKHAL